MGRIAMTIGGAAARGLLAGAIGTAAMTVWQELSARLRSPGEDGAGPDGTERSPDPWEHAAAPAKVGRKMLEDVFHYEVPPDEIGLLTTVMHWGYGISWGPIYGLNPATARSPGIRSGLLFGAAVWAMSYVTLVPMGIYEPPWRYQPRELAMDLSYHLVYGGGVGAGYAAVSGLAGRG